MWKLFKRRDTGLMSSQRLFSKVATLTRQRLQKMAQWLELQTKTWSRLEWKILVIIFCTLTFIVCGWIIRGSFLHPIPILNPEVRIRPLQHFRPVESASHPKVILDDLLLYKKKLDSLKAHDCSQFDMILQVNPTLIDSLDQLIRLYQSPIK